MEEHTYNGWTNYETWAVGLWLDNEEPSYRYWREQAQEQHNAAGTCERVLEGTWTREQAAKFQLADRLKEAITEATPLQEASLYSDLLNAALSEVNWQEIAEHYLADLPKPEDDLFGPVVYAYTRANALADGVLVDVSELAKEAGVTYPTALTAAAWEACVKVPAAVPWQDEKGRLWDILTMLRYSIARSDGGQELIFTVDVQNDERPPRSVQLKAHCGPGDAGEPVITVMCPDED